MAIDAVVGECLAETVGRATAIRPRFLNRLEAGRQLAAVLDARHFLDPVIVTVPYGGIPVAAMVQDKLEAPLFVSYAAKVPAHAGEGRFGIGSVGPSGSLLNLPLIDFLGIGSDRQFEFVELAKNHLLTKIVELEEYCSPMPDLQGKDVLLVDDGIATGYTLLSVAQSITRQDPASIVLSAPVVSRQAHDLLAEEYQIISLLTADEPAFLVDNFYQDFTAISPAEARNMLKAS